MRIFIKFGMWSGILLAAFLSGCGGAPSSSEGAAPTALKTQKMVDGGGSHTLMLKEDGTVWAWGDNSRGQLGNDVVYSTAISDSPVLADVAMIAAGGAHSLALKKDGTVWGWGDSRYGQAGDGRFVLPTTPITIAIGRSVPFTSRLYDFKSTADGNLQISNLTATPIIISDEYSFCIRWFRVRRKF